MIPRIKIRMQYRTCGEYYQVMFDICGSFVDYSVEVQVTKTSEDASEHAFDNSIYGE